MTTMPETPPDDVIEAMAEAMLPDWVHSEKLQPYAYQYARAAYDAARKTLGDAR